MISRVDIHDEPLATRRADRFLIFVVPSNFQRQYYATTWALLQTSSCSKLLDLTPAASVEPDLFEALANAWTAPRSSVPRLGFVLPFDRWAVLHDRAVKALAPLMDRGIEIAVLYEQQARGDHLQSWFAHGRILHDVPAVLEWLLTLWTPGATGPLVLDTAVNLVRMHAFTADVPALLADTAELALLCDSAAQGESLAREALYYLSTSPSSTRARALRCLGTALMLRDQRQAGLAELDHAVAMADAAEDPIASATALYQAGAFLLEDQAYTDAERRLQKMIALLQPLPGCRNLLASAHHSLALALALALARQGKADDAHRHGTTALAMRPKAGSSLAEQDRRLLAMLAELQTKVN